MDTTTSLKMTSLAIQSLFSYVEEENLAAIKAHLDKFRDVDSRSDVSQPYLNNPPFAQDIYFRDKNAVIKVWWWIIEIFFYIKKSFSVNQAHRATKNPVDPMFYTNKQELQRGLTSLYRHNILIEKLSTDAMYPERNKVWV